MVNVNEKADSHQIRIANSGRIGETNCAHGNSFSNSLRNCEFLSGVNGGPLQQTDSKFSHCQKFLQHSWHLEDVISRFPTFHAIQ